MPEWYLEKQQNNISFFSDYWSVAQFHVFAPFHHVHVSRRQWERLQVYAWLTNLLRTPEFYAEGSMVWMWERKDAFNGGTCWTTLRYSRVLTRKWGINLGAFWKLFEWIVDVTNCLTSKEIRSRINQHLLSVNVCTSKKKLFFA